MDTSISLFFNKRILSVSVQIFLINMLLINVSIMNTRFELGFIGKIITVIPVKLI